MSENKHSNFWLQVCAGLVVAALIGLASIVPEAFKWLTDYVNTAWIHLQKQSELPNWAVYLFALLGVCTVIQLVARVIKRDPLNFTHYTQDTFFDVTWRWGYLNGGIESVAAYCPICDTALVHSETTSIVLPITTLFCETCNQNMLTHTSDYYQLTQKVMRKIDRELRTNNWLNTVQNNQHKKNKN